MAYILIKTFWLIYRTSYSTLQAANNGITLHSCLSTSSLISFLCNDMTLILMIWYLVIFANEFVFLCSPSFKTDEKKNQWVRFTFLCYRISFKSAKQFTCVTKNLHVHRFFQLWQWKCISLKIVQCKNSRIEITIFNLAWTKDFRSNGCIYSGFHIFKFGSRRLNELSVSIHCKRIYQAAAGGKSDINPHFLNKAFPFGFY